MKDRYVEEDVDIVLSADETFLKFHERSGTLLVPSGSKRVGSSATYDDKDGCTLMVTMDMISSQLLNPLIIFSGELGGIS